MNNCIVVLLYFDYIVMGRPRCPIKGSFSSFCFSDQATIKYIKLVFLNIKILFTFSRLSLLSI